MLRSTPSKSASEGLLSTPAQGGDLGQGERAWMKLTVWGTLTPAAQQNSRRFQAAAGCRVAVGFQVWEQKSRSGHPGRSSLLHPNRSGGSVSIAWQACHAVQNSSINP